MDLSRHDYRIQDIHRSLGCWSELFFPPPARRGLRGQPYKVLQGMNRLRRRGFSLSVRVVKYWNKLPASVVTVPSVKKRLANVWTGLFQSSPLAEHSSSHFFCSPPYPTCTPPTNSYHLYMLPNCRLYLFRWQRAHLHFSISCKIYLSGCQMACGSPENAITELICLN